jgi:hypothetical protein
MTSGGPVPTTGWMGGDGNAGRCVRWREWHDGLLMRMGRRPITAKGTHPYGAGAPVSA